MAGKPTVTLVFDGDEDKLSKAFDRVEKNAGKMSQGVSTASDDMEKKSSKSSMALRGAMAAGAAGIAGFAAAGASSLLEMGKSLTAMDVKAKTVFQGQLPVIQNWAEANRKAFGASSREVVGMAASMTDLLKPMGFTTQQATEMSMKMLDLSGALSRWSGGTKTAAEVSDLLADAMLGETDGLKALGIAISAADVQARIALKGQQDLEGAARAQAEAVATQELILEKSTDAQAAWANGGKEAAEAQNGAASSIQESMENLAIAAQPLIEFATKILSTFMEWAANNPAIVTAIGATVAAIWLLNAALYANPIVWIIALIGALVVGLIWLWNNVDGFRNFWIDVWEGAKLQFEAFIGYVKKLWDDFSTAMSAVGGFIKRTWNGIGDFFSGFGDRVSRIFSNVGSAISNAFKGAVNGVIGLLNGAIGAINALIRGVNNVSGAVGIPAIPQIPKIPRMHTGGVVPGIPGEEVLTILQAGERVSTSGQGGVTTMVITGNGGLYEAVHYGLRTGEIQLIDQSGNRILVA